MRNNLLQVVRGLLASADGVSSTQIARAAGISRQAVLKQLRRLLRDGVLTASGKARACRYRLSTSPAVPLRQRLEVAPVGAQFRLSARALLDSALAKDVVLDFRGVEEVGEEFLDEVFLVWAPAHRGVELHLENYPLAHARLLYHLAKKSRAFGLSSAAA